MSNIKKILSQLFIRQKVLKKFDPSVFGNSFDHSRVKSILYVEEYIHILFIPFNPLDKYWILLGQNWKLKVTESQFRKIYPYRKIRNSRWYIYLLSWILIISVSIGISQLNRFQKGIVITKNHLTEKMLKVDSVIEFFYNQNSNYYDPQYDKYVYDIKSINQMYSDAGKTQLFKIDNMSESNTFVVATGCYYSTYLDYFPNNSTIHSLKNGEWNSIYAVKYWNELERFNKLKYLVYCKMVKKVQPPENNNENSSSIYTYNKLMVYKIDNLKLYHTYECVFEIAIDNANEPFSEGINSGIEMEAMYKRKVYQFLFHPSDTNRNFH